MADDDQEKTEQPTQKKLDKAKEDGQVPRSKELTTFVMLFCSFLALWFLGSTLYDGLGEIMRSSFSFDRLMVFDPEPSIMKTTELGMDGLFMLMPFLAITFVLALIAPNLLSGPLISMKSLKPKISKINPVSGFKRIFSEQALVELAKTIAKSVLIGASLYVFIQFKKGDFMGLLNQPHEEAVLTALSLAFQVVMIMTGTLVVAAIIDVPFQIFSHKKKLKMSMYEIKKEFKESEGDPMVKARIRQQQQEMSRNRMMAEVPKADVVINNPTHFSVALKYTEDMAAPIVVAKGRNGIALRIREIAEENKVPMLEAPPLARALYQHVDLEHPIPESLFHAVAEVLRWVFQMKEMGWADRPVNLPVPEGMDVVNNMDSENG